MSPRPRSQVALEAGAVEDGEPARRGRGEAFDDRLRAARRWQCRDDPGRLGAVRPGAADAMRSTFALMTSEEVDAREEGPQSSRRPSGSAGTRGRVRSGDPAVEAERGEVDEVRGPAPTVASGHGRKDPWRIAVVSMVAPLVERLVPVLRELGHEPVGVVTARSERDRPRTWRSGTRPFRLGSTSSSRGTSGRSSRCSAPSGPT